MEVFNFPPKVIVFLVLILFYIAYDRISVYHYASKINKAFAELQKEQPNIFYNLFNSIEIGETNLTVIETINVFIKANISKIFACIKRYNKIIVIQQDGEKYELLDLKLLNPSLIKKDLRLKILEKSFRVIGSKNPISYLNGKSLELHFFIDEKPDMEKLLVIRVKIENQIFKYFP